MAEGTTSQWDTQHDRLPKEAYNHDIWMKSVEEKTDLIPDPAHLGILANKVGYCLSKVRLYFNCFVLVITHQCWHLSTLAPGKWLQQCLFTLYIRQFI